MGSEIEAPALSLMILRVLDTLRGPTAGPASRWFRRSRDEGDETHKQEEGDVEGAGVGFQELEGGRGLPTQLLLRSLCGSHLRA